MPIDFTPVLKTIDGANMTDVGSKDGTQIVVDLSLSRVACTSLLGNIPGEPSADAEEHLKRFMLANYIKDNAAAELSSDEITLIKSRISKAFNNAIIVGQATLLLDPAAATPFARDRLKKKAA